MGPLIGKVMSMGRDAAQGGATVANRVWNIPGNAGRMGVDKLESATYNHLMKNAGDRAETLAQNAYMRPDFKKPVATGYGFGDMPGATEAAAHEMAETLNTVSRQNRDSVFNALRDNEFANLQDRAKRQAALVPGGLRFAGQAAKSPLAMTAYSVGGTLAAGNMMEEQGRREQLMAMGLSAEEAEILENELLMAAQAMEPTEYV